MGDEFYRLSTVTGKKYNYFNTVKLLNLNQCMYYMEQDVFPVDIKITKNDKGNKCLVFYYDKDATKTLYEEWLNQRKRG